MKTTWNNILTVLAFILATACTGPEFTKMETKLEPFAVSYEKIPNLRETAQEYDLLIVEPDHYSKLETDSLNTPTNKLIAYISLGEVASYRWYYPLLKERGFLGTNKNWNSSYLNLADSVTRSILMDQVIPNIMRKGYDGLFLDTVDDVAPYTKRSHLQPYMADIIRQIRHNYPEAFIIQNAGLFLLDKTSGLIDAVVIEDVATSYDFSNNSYSLKEKQKYKAKVKQIEEYSGRYQKPFLFVDFSSSHSLNKLIQSRLDTLPYPYFINNIELDDISGGTSSKHR